MNKIITKIKKDNNYSQDIIIREKKINSQKLYIVYMEPLVSSDKISENIMKSLDNIKYSLNIFKSIKNNIYNFKVTEVCNYDDLIFYLHRGFTLIIYKYKNKFLVLETRGNLARSVSNPLTENTIRGSKDAFVEEIQTNIGLVRKRIKNNNLWEKDYYIGKYTQTKVTVMSINGLVNQKLLKYINYRLQKIKIDGLINGEVLKTKLLKRNYGFLPQIITSERPDVVSTHLIEGRICLLIDNTNYALILPATFNDFFKSPEDNYSKNINVSLTRIIRYLCFFIAISTPGIYIALITYNQEIVPSNLLISFASQREGVPFPAFIEAFVLLFSFEVIREADLRNPSNIASSLSIVGALILGEAAVSASIVSPIMIIVIAISSICSMPFPEFEFISGLRFYKLIFMIGGTTLGMMGIVFAFLILLTELINTKSFNYPFMAPFVPLDFEGIKNSFVKTKSKKRPTKINKSYWRV